MYSNQDWRRSSHSGTGPDSNCVEVASLGQHVLIRDSKQARGWSYPTLQADAENWQSLIETIVE